MDLGRIAGQILLALVDAVAAGGFAALVAYLALPVVWTDGELELVVVVGTLVTGVVLAIGLALVRRGRRPFPATRLVKAAFDRWLWRL